MKSKIDNTFVFYIITIILSFIIWCFVRIEEYENKISTLESEKKYVKIEELKTKIKFESFDDNVIILKDWNVIQKWEISKIKE